MANIKFTKQKLTRQSTALLAAADSLSSCGKFGLADFKGQAKIPHNHRNNRKTKRGKK